MTSETLHTEFGTARINPNGYYQISSRKEGNHNKLLHRLIFEKFYQIKLPRNIAIHHEDENPLNNEIWNLVPMTRSEHVIVHRKGKPLSEEHKQKLSESKKGEKHPFYGKPRTKETREKIRQKNMGHEVSEETRQKISESNKGKKRSQEFAERLSESRSSTGYYRVSIHKNKNYKNGFGYRYQWHDEMGKRHKLESASIDKLKEKVLARGLKWLQFEEDIE